MDMEQRLLRFTYPPEMINEPIIYQLVTEFDVVINLRRANVTRDRGWVILELRGETSMLDRAVRWAQDKGLVVEPVVGDTASPSPSPDSGEGDGGRSG